MIIIDYNQFAMNSIIIVSTDKEAKKFVVESNLEKLAEDATALAYSYETFQIKVSGAAPQILEELKEQIKQSESKNFSNNIITVEAM
jgi:undecaprenyl pyrophosphate synthase